MSQTFLPSELTDALLQTGSTDKRTMLKFDKCPRCELQYDFLKRGATSRVPLVLKCNHTTCEDCLRRLHSQNLLFCPVCKEQIIVTIENIKDLTKAFPPHFALVGYLMWLKNGCGAKREISWVSTGVTLNNKQASDPSGEPSMILPISDLDRDIQDIYAEALESTKLEKCSQHVGEYANVFCEDCSLVCCCYCFMEVHGGHTHAYLHKLNENEHQEIEDFREQMLLVLAHLHSSKQRMKQLKSFDLAQAEDEIQKFFLEMHAKLQVAEQNIKDRLRTLDVEEADLEEIKDHVNTGIGRLTALKKIMSENWKESKELNRRVFYEEVKKMSMWPCRLVDDQKGAAQRLQLVFENDLEDFEDTVVLKAGRKPEYMLEPLEKLTKHQEVEDDLVPSSSRSSLDMTVSQETDEENVVEERKPTKKTPSRLRGTEVLRVVLTHVNDLNSFYVQKHAALARLQYVNSFVEKSKRNVNVANIKPNGIYAVEYEVKSKKFWRRGKLLDVVNDSDKVLYKMFFIDYGNTQHVTKDKLKDLDFRTRHRGPFAFECKLTNPDNVDFGPQAHLHLVNIIGEKQLHLCYKNNSVNGVEEVDLLVPTSTGSLISVVELLARTPTIEAIFQKGLVLNNELKLFRNRKIFQVGEKLAVVVTHVRDPFYIGVVMEENVTALRDLKTQMAEYYDKQPTNSCVPLKGTDVVVKYENEDQGMWHRATVESVDPTGSAEVLLVDSGHQVSVPWSSVKLLSPNFIKMECQAIIVKMADVGKGRTEWDKASADLILNYLPPDRACKFLISGLNPLQGALFTVDAMEDRCLNAVLVEHGEANSLGPLSEKEHWPNIQDEEVHEIDMSVQLVRKCEQVLMEDSGTDEVDKMKQGVKVIRCESPDLIYIKFNKNENSDFELHQHLQIHYTSARKSKKSWSVGEHCVVYESKEYARAIIKTSLTRSKYLVYLYDKAREVDVHSNQMYNLQPHFRNYQCSTYKCRLSNIKPAGDAGTWSNLATDILSKIFEMHKHIFVAKTEINLDKKMLGVDMWYTVMVPTKALEPSRVKYISINQALLQSGVAFSVQSGDSKIKENCEDKGSKDHQDWNELINEEERKLVTHASTWPKPCEVTKIDFDAFMICVDNFGNFLIRDHDMHDVYLDLETRLSQKFRGMKISDSNKEWIEGDMCTISYDGKWYRGTVMSVSSDAEINVEMIDFGSLHNVSKEALSEMIMFPDIPPLLFKIRLYDVYSHYGLWTAEDINDVVRCLKDHMRVVIKKFPEHEIPEAEIYLDHSESLNEFIAREFSHMYRERKAEEIDDESIKDETSDSLNNCYEYAPLPDDKQRHDMQIEGILKSEGEFKVLLNVGTENVTDYSNELAQLSNDISKKVADQPVLRKTKVNQPCVCLHPNKNSWSRATIYKLDKSNQDLVLVFFVDYGDIEMIETKNLKVMRPEWFDFLVRIRMATINIELVQSDMIDEAMDQLNSLNRTTVAVDMVSENPLRVHLYNGTSLCYQNLVDCGIIKAL